MHINALSQNLAACFRKSVTTTTQNLELIEKSGEPSKPFAIHHKKMADHLISFGLLPLILRINRAQRSAATIGINMSNQLGLIIISILVPFLVVSLIVDRETCR